MKRIGNVYQRVVSLENLYRASYKAQKGKSKKREVREWNRNLADNINKLQDDLLTGNYTVSKYYVFTIFEPKERVISKLPFRDRVVHHALMNIIEPMLEKGFISQTYACIKKRGVHKGLRDVTKALRDRKGTQYALKLDIKKFYPSVDNSLLKAVLRTKFKDPYLLGLMAKIIDSCEGLPLGNFTSQWFGNLYVSRFDRWMKQERGIKNYFRYSDDILILHESKEFLYQLKLDIIDFMRDNLRLELSNYQVFPVSKRPIDFLGYVIDHDKVWIRKSIKQNFKKKRFFLKSISSYMGWTLHADCRNLEYSILLKDD